MLSKNPLIYLQQQNLQEALLYGQKIGKGNFPLSLLLCYPIYADVINF